MAPLTSNCFPLLIINELVGDKARLELNLPDARRLIGDHGSSDLFPIASVIVVCDAGMKYIPEDDSLDLLQQWKISPLAGLDRHDYFEHQQLGAQ